MVNLLFSGLPYAFLWTSVLICGMCLYYKGGVEMARISIEKKCRGEGGGAKCVVGGIMELLCRRLLATTYQRNTTSRCISNC